MFETLQSEHSSVMILIFITNRSEDCKNNVWSHCLA